MKQLVIMPGGFHPFHAGHYALYQAAQQAFPDADIKVAATNDTSQRPFPFKIKEKLAQLAGVAPGDFYQVKSPFRAEEITKNYNPEHTQLIFVRSEKDATKPPQAGGIKKNGEPAYLQPLAGQKSLLPMSQHAYMAYLPTVEFGPGMTSATEIRTAWPTLNDRRKTALVMSLYPRTQNNPKLAATVVKMLDTAIGTEKEINETRIINPGRIDVFYRPDPHSHDRRVVAKDIPTRALDLLLAKLSNKFGIPERDFEWSSTDKQVNERKKDNDVGASIFANPRKLHDPELIQAKQFAKTHYPGYSNDPDEAFDKWVQRGLMHSEQNDREHDKKLQDLSRQVQQLKKELDQAQGNSDYIEEKWSQKYKRSIDCAHPRGFSQRAHCAGRKK